MAAAVSALLTAKTPLSIVERVQRKIETLLCNQFSVLQGDNRIVT